MKFKNRGDCVVLEEDVFKTRGDGSEFGDWVWWFWLFFLDDPSVVDKPRQMAVIWSIKDDSSIKCNGSVFNFDTQSEDAEGVVASWYFDGEKMHHDFLLEKSYMDIGPGSLGTEGEVPTKFCIDGNDCSVSIGKDFHFKAKVCQDYDFAINSTSSGEYPLGMNYSMLKSNRLGLKGEIKEEAVEGSAYFQRVDVNAPTPSWYWGIFHFENGGFLDYYKPHIFGKSLKEEIAFYDGNKTHEFSEVSVDIEEKGELPSFHISAEAESGNKKINFTVRPYSKASWKFEKKVARIIPTELIYREYPAKISQLKLVDKKKEWKITLDNLGSSVGNAEYTTGFLL